MSLHQALVYRDYLVPQALMFIVVGRLHRRSSLSWWADSKALEFIAIVRLQTGLAFHANVNQRG